MNTDSITNLMMKKIMVQLEVMKIIKTKYMMKKMTEMTTRIMKIIMMSITQIKIKFFLIIKIVKIQIIIR